MRDNPLVVCVGEALGAYADGEPFAIGLGISEPVATEPMGACEAGLRGYLAHALCPAVLPRARTLVSRRKADERIGRARDEC